VAQALSIVGATRARLRFEEVRALKETRNQLHRKVNGRGGQPGARDAGCGAVRWVAFGFLRHEGVWRDFRRVLQK